MYKLGIDVGGTNTDAVIINDKLEVVADIKHPTTGDVYDGILCAIHDVLEASGVDRKEITQAMLGTTQCTNAIVERKNLARIGLVRIGAPPPPRHPAHGGLGPPTFRRSSRSP